MSAPQLNFGYCCINTRLRKKNIFTSRTCRLNTAKIKSINYLYELVHKNLDDLKTIIEWNHQHNISVFRMSSEMFPFATHCDYRNDFNISQFEDKLRNIGELAKKYNQRLTFHPCQYILLSSLREIVSENSIIDLNFHAKIMDLMGLGKDSVIVIHGGSKSGGIEASLTRFKENFFKLSPSAQSRLVVENCEMSFTVANLLPLCKELKIPLVFDSHHYNLNKGEGEISFLLKEIISTWTIRDIIPKFHISESRTEVLDSDNITVKRRHSDYIENLPDFYKFIDYHDRIDVMLEAKMKEDALFKLLFNQQTYKKKSLNPMLGTKKSKTVGEDYFNRIVSYFL